MKNMNANVPKPPNTRPASIVPDTGMSENRELIVRITAPPAATRTAAFTASILARGAVALTTFFWLPTLARGATT